MAINWRADKAWSDQFIPTIKGIIGPKLLMVSRLEKEDALEATDLIILKAKDMRIACRVRRPGFARKYYSQFTIRSERDSGTKTELRKFMEGYGDWMFYGHSTGNGVEISPWYLLDLDIFRQYCKTHKDKIRYGKQPNGDGTHFTWFDIDSFPVNLVIGCSTESYELML